jgi:sugar phosphate isomerase/epimerase
MYSRRDLARLALTAVPASRLLAKPNSVVNGVAIGVQSYSFRDRSLDEAIKAMVDIGFSSCELWQGHVEPPKMKREELRQWRLTVSMDELKKVRDKFNQAGIKLCAYNYSFRDDFTDEEIARGFEMGKALGVKALTASSNVSTAKRVDPFAAKAKMLVGMHNHSNIKPNEFARPDDFEDAMRGASKYIGVNLDIGHFVAVGFDPVAYIEKRHDRMPTIHLKDRKKNQGANLPFGEGDTPIRECLQLLRTRKWKIPAVIEYEYKGADTVAEVRRCFEYCKRALQVGA